MRKRFISIVLAVLLVVGIVPLTALAHSGNHDSHDHENILAGIHVIIEAGDGGSINSPGSQSNPSEGETWSFSAVPDPGYRFDSWTYNGNGVSGAFQTASDNPNLSVRFTEDAWVWKVWRFVWTETKTYRAQAVFAPLPQYSLSTNVTGNGSIVKNPVQTTYYENQEVSLTANADPGWKFTGWSGDVSDTAETITVAMNSNKSITANFEILPTYTLNINTVGDGTVSKDPDASEYWQGRNVTLTANPAGGWRFGGWSGDASGTGNPVTMSMDGAKNVTATFIKTFNITLNVDGPGKLDNKNAVAGVRDENSAINLDDAQPNARPTCKFIGWRDDATNQYVTSTFTLTGDRSFTAVFGDREYLFTSAGDNGRLRNDLDGHRARYETVDLNDAQPTPDPGYTLDCWKEYGFLWSGSGKVVSLTDGKPIVTIGDSNWFRAHFKVANYNIYYNLNGGSVSSNPSTYTYFDNAFALSNPTRTGYIFAGWTGTGLSGLATSVTIPRNSSGERTYTANWTPITYTIAYDANGGSGSMASSSYEYDEEKALSENTFAKQGCDFAGWAKSSQESVVYSDKQAVKNLTETNGATVTLYAKWQVGGVTVSGYDAEYDGQPHSVAVTGDLSGATVTYSTDGGVTYSGTKPEYTNATDAKTVCVKVERSGAAPFVDSATVKISKKTLTVKAKNKTISYGDAAPVYTFKYSGFVNGENKNVLSGDPLLNCAYVEGMDADKYPITVSLGTLSAENYAFDLAEGTLTVNKVKLTVTADDKSITYYDEAPAYTATITGFVRGEKQEDVLAGTPKITCAYSKGNDVGNYDIVVKKGSLDATNYSFKFDDGILTVDKAELTVTADDQFVVYGEAAPSSYPFVITGYVGGQDQSVVRGAPEVTCIYAAGDDAGLYPIQVGLNTLDADNYTFKCTAGTLTVTPAALIVTADDKTVTFNDVPPAYSVSYSGFVAGDDETNLAGSLTFDCPYVTGSAVGTYNILPGGLISGNYAITFDPGTLTVDELILTVAFEDYDGTVLDTQQIVYGNAAKAPAAPEREGYNFTGWNKAFDAVTDNMTVTAQYAMKTFTVTFYEQDGVTPIGSLQTVNWGSAAVFETAPAVTGYAFDQWVLTGSDAKETDSLTNVKEDIKAVASYIRNGYTVTFVDFQGQVIGTDGVLHGESATAPVVPARVGYTFTGWDTSFDNVTSNMTVTALYTINTYTVRFVDFDAAELSVQTVNWNTAATAPANPTRTGFTFTGWDTVFSAVTEDLVVTAQYRRNALATAAAVDDNAQDDGDTQNDGNTQNDGDTQGNQGDTDNQNDPQTLADEPVPGTLDDDVTTLKEEAVPQAPSSVFPWWWILIILAAAGTAWFIIYKVRKNREEEN